MVLALSTTGTTAKAREMPEFKSYRQRADFLLFGASRIAPSTGKDGYGTAMSLIATAYAKWGNSAKAREAILGAPKGKHRASVQCSVAKELANAGKPDEAEAIFNEIGDIELVTDASFLGLGRIDEKQLARDAIDKARGSLVTPQTLGEWRHYLSEAKAPGQMSYRLGKLVSLMIELERTADLEQTITGVHDPVARDTARSIAIQAFGRKNQVDQALLQFDKLESRPRAHAAPSRLLDGLVEGGHWDTLKKTSLAMQKKHPGAASMGLGKLAAAQAEGGDLDAVTAIIDLAVPEKRSSAACIVAESLIAHGHLDSALALSRKYIVEPSSSGIASKLAFAWAEKGNYPQARQLVDGAELTPRSRAEIELRCAGAAAANKHIGEAKSFIAAGKSRIAQMASHSDKEWTQRELAKAYAEVGDGEGFLKTIAAIEQPTQKNGFDFRQDSIIGAGVVLARQNQMAPILKSLRLLPDPQSQVVALTRIAERLAPRPK